MKGLFTILIVILSINCLGQNKPFIGVSYNTIGHSLQLGVKNENRVLTIGYSFPITSAINPALVFGTVGHQFNLGKDYAITTATGFSFYNTIKSVKQIATFEVSKDIHNGRLFITANYCKVFFAGAGFKIFII
jgi:hypothetical protein